MIPTETISVINRYTENNEDKYQSTIIHGVFWFGNVLSSLSAEGYNAANQFVIRIPAKSASIPQERELSLHEGQGHKPKT